MINSQVKDGAEQIRISQSISVIFLAEDRLLCTPVKETRQLYSLTSFAKSKQKKLWKSLIIL